MLALIGFVVTSSRVTSNFLKFVLKVYGFYYGLCFGEQGTHNNPVFYTIFSIGIRYNALLMSYPIPAKITEQTYEVKKSKFIACASFANSREQAMEQLALIKLQYPDARHHCWAYLLGNPDSPASVAMSDDGEPSGTAGKPILNVLQHKGIGDIMLVVTRYFGGIKLGAGGLVRAYSNSAQQVIEALPIQEQIVLLPLHLLSDFKHEQFIRHLTNQHHGVIDECEYAEMVRIQVSLPDAEIPAFIASCHKVGIQVIQS
ncbi:hypothetical protein NBRC116595_29900 [Aliiglaciecola sp. NS0011-25]